jgi:hypothetical protein
MFGTAAVLGGVQPAAAFDFQDPVVPSQFLMSAPVAAAPSPSGGMRLLAQGEPAASRVAPGPAADDPPESGSAGAIWPHDGAPGLLRIIPGSQWSDDRGGCAIWDWASC